MHAFTCTHPYAHISEEAKEAKEEALLVRRVREREVEGERAEGEAEGEAPSCGSRAERWPRFLLGVDGSLSAQVAA